MYRDYSLHVAQFKALSTGLVLFPKVIGPFTFNHGLAGSYNPALASALLKGRTV